MRLTKDKLNSAIVMLLLIASILILKIINNSDDALLRLKWEKEYLFDKKIIFDTMEFKLRPLSFIIIRKNDYYISIMDLKPEHDCILTFFKGERYRRPNMEIKYTPFIRDLEYCNIDRMGHKNIAYYQRRHDVYIDIVTRSDDKLSSEVVKGILSGYFELDF